MVFTAFPVIAAAASSSLLAAEKPVYHNLLYQICQGNFLNHYVLKTV
jgi:hypothetical protein